MELEVVVEELKEEKISKVLGFKVLGKIDLDKFKMFINKEVE